MDDDMTYEEPISLGDLHTDASKIHISLKPMGPGRQDRATVLEDSTTQINSSAIMMGYNKARVVFPDGTYVSVEEFSETLNTAIDENVAENRTILCKRTGMTVEKSGLFSSILNLARQGAEIYLDGSSEVITNQETSNISVKGEGQLVGEPKGVLMLGNNKIQMPNGEYVSLEEINNAIEEHVYVDKKPKTTKVIKRVKTKWNIIPIIIDVILTVLMGMNIISSTDAQHVNITTEQMNYAITHVMENAHEMSDEEFAKSMFSELKTGSEINVPEGVKYYASSDSPIYAPNNHGTFGQGQREAGEYNVDYISIVHDGRIVKVERMENIGVIDTIEEYCNVNNLNYEEITVMLHLGGPVSGWVKLDDIVEKTAFDSNKQTIIIEEKENYTGQENNFQGHITINDGDENVVINLLDENGDLIKENSVVTGSDNQQYRIVKLDKQEVTEMEEISAATPERLTWSIHNITKEEALFAAAVAIGGTIIFKRKEEETTELTEEEIKLKVEEFKEEHEKDLVFASDSMFLQVVNKLSTKQPNWAAISFSWPGIKGDIVYDRISEGYDGPKTK